MTDRFVEKQFERPNYFVNLEADPGEGWQNGVTVGERYYQAKIGLFLYFRIRSRRDNVVPGVFCAYLERATGKILGMRDDAILRDIPTHEAVNGVDEAKLQCPVLVSVAEPLQQGQGMRFRGIPVPSVIWLKPLDHSCMQGVEIGDLISPKITGRGRDGELGVSLRFSGFAPTPEFQGRQLPRQMVERAAKVLQGVGGDKHPTVADLGNLDYLDAHGLRLRIELGVEANGFTLLGAGTDFGLERFDMLVCPIDLTPAASQGENVEDALENMGEAMSLTLEDTT